MRTTIKRGFTRALGAGHHSTRAALSFQAVVVGLLSSTVTCLPCHYPAFYSSHDIAIPGAVNRHEDKSLGITRIEITCTACGGHLGHVFKGEGFKTPSASHRLVLISFLAYCNESKQRTNVIALTRYHSNSTMSEQGADCALCRCRKNKCD